MCGDMLPFSLFQFSYRMTDKPIHKQCSLKVKRSREGGWDGKQGSIASLKKKTENMYSRFEHGHSRFKAFSASLQKKKIRGCGYLTPIAALFKPTGSQTGYNQGKMQTPENRANNSV